MSECVCAKDWQYLAQFLVLCFAFVALVLKNRSEQQQRDFDVWCLDASKQSVGYAMSIGVDIVFFQVFTRGCIHDGEDECEVYFMNYLYNTVFGATFNVGGIYCLKLLVLKYVPSQRYKDFLKFGYYGDPFSWNIYLVQLFLWVLIVLIGKLVIVLLYVVITPNLGSIFRLVFSIFSHSSQLKFLLIAFIFPILLTSAVVWLQDVYLMYDKAEDESQRYLVRCYIIIS